MNAIEERAASARSLAGADTVEAISQVIAQVLVRHGAVDAPYEAWGRFVLLQSPYGDDQGEEEIREHLLAQSRNQEDIHRQKEWLTTPAQTGAMSEEAVFDEAAEVICDALCALSMLGLDHMAIMELNARIESRFMESRTPLVVEGDVSDLLLAALEREGIDEAGVRIFEDCIEGVKVNCEDGSHLFVTDRAGARIAYPAHEHTGLLINRYPADEDHSEWSVVYDSSQTDAEVDVQDAVEAIVAELRHYYQDDGGRMQVWMAYDRDRRETRVSLWSSFEEAAGFIARGVREVWHETGHEQPPATSDRELLAQYYGPLHEWTTSEPYYCPHDDWADESFEICRLKVDGPDVLRYDT